MRSTCSILFVASLAAASSLTSVALAESATPLQNPNPTVQAPANPQDSSQSMSRQELQNQQRKDQLTADTAKLLQLANELKAEMDKSTKDTLSVSVLKKAEQVEKLAHKVRDEMKLTIGN
jgi:hypothetical protein